MRSSWQWVGLAVVVAAIAIGVACGGGGSEDHSVLGPADSGYAGPADAGPDGGPPDAGPTDGGTPLKNVIFPTTANWDFYGPQNGGPQDVLDVAMDEREETQPGREHEQAFGELEDGDEAQLRSEPAAQIRRPLTCNTQFFVVVHFELRATSARKGYRR